MKKGIKILIGVVILLIVLAVTYIVLIIKGILPNPLLDTSDLVCTRVIEFETYTEETVYTFKFDKWAKLEEYEKNLNIIYPTLEDAEEYYNMQKKYISKIEFNREKNMIIFPSVIFANKEDTYHFEKNKQEIKDTYINKGYTCKKGEKNEK